MTLIAFPASGYPYTERLYGAVRAQGVDVAEGEFAGRWLRVNVRAGDVLHLHWPSFFYDDPAPPWKVVVNFLRFAMLLLFARARGGRIFWTAHNLMPHERVRPRWVDGAARRLCIALCERIFVHGDRAAQVLVDRFPSTRRKVAIIRHGHLVGYYPRTVSREEARARLSIAPSAYLYLFLGGCKPYKGLEGLVRAFREVPGNSVLLIAGRFTDAAYQRAVEDLANGDPRVRLEPRFVPDDQVQDFLVACDVVVAPYRDVLTSGTVMLAHAFGRPIVSVRLGCLPDVVPPDAGVLYDPDVSRGLEDALAQVQRLRFSEDAILTHTLQFDWAATASVLAGACHRGGTRV